MRVQILTALKAEFPAVNAEILNRVATHLAKTVTKEEEVQPAVEGSKELVKEMSDFFQRETDRRVTDALTKREKEQKEKEEADKKAADEKGKKKADETGGNEDEPPAWAKDLVKSHQELTQKLNSLEAEKTQTSLRERVSAALKDKVPSQFSNKLITSKNFKDEAEADAFATEIETDWASIAKDMGEQGQGQTPPFKPAGNPTGISPEVKDFLKANTGGEDTGLQGKKI